VRTWQRLALGGRIALALVVVLLAVGFYWMISSLDDLCGNTVVVTELSPSRAMTAVLFERDCGATTGFSSQVSVLRADEDLPNAGGNVFAKNEAKGGEATSWGGPFVALQWRDAHTLALKYDSSADVRFKADRLGEVMVVLEAQP
jgi:hypothetical protein